MAKGPKVEFRKPDDVIKVAGKIVGYIYKVGKEIVITTIEGAKKTPTNLRK
ncbi:hypothetical protein [Hippea alviniae]|uniref:hypothetical protein n=1 Tax=Hippea alviniae TaxID=1279027 RepID=UPI0003B61471|nr:hypothetical protein [Hippea alviniae]